MGIKIDHHGDDKYTAIVAPPHGSRPLEVTHPIGSAQMVRQLLEIGCHQTDIGDAFSEANPDWLSRT